MRMSVQKSVMKLWFYWDFRVLALHEINGSTYVCAYVHAKICALHEGGNFMYSRKLYYLDLNRRDSECSQNA